MKALSLLMAFRIISEGPMSFNQLIEDIKQTVHQSKMMKQNILKTYKNNIFGPKQMDIGELGVYF